MNKINSTKLEAALTELVNRIADGQEFPAACWSVAERRGVSYIGLSDAYDLRCVVGKLVSELPSLDLGA